VGQERQLSGCELQVAQTGLQLWQIDPEIYEFEGHELAQTVGLVGDIFG